MREPITGCSTPSRVPTSNEIPPAVPAYSPAPSGNGLPLTERRQKGGGTDTASTGRRLSLDASAPEMALDAVQAADRRIGSLIHFLRKTEAKLRAVEGYIPSGRSYTSRVVSRLGAVQRSLLYRIEDELKMNQERKRRHDRMLIQAAPLAEVERLVPAMVDSSRLLSIAASCGSSNCGAEFLEPARGAPKPERVRLEDINAGWRIVADKPLGVAAWRWMLPQADIKALGHERDAGRIMTAQRRDGDSWLLLARLAAVKAPVRTHLEARA